MHKNKSFLAAICLLLTAPAFAGEGPFTAEELHVKFRAMLFGLNKEYNAEPVEDRPEGCVTFEVRIQRDGVASWFRRKQGEFRNHGLLKRLEMAVINRFDMPKGRLLEPQIALQELCFNRDTGVSLPKGMEPALPPPKKAEEMLEVEHDGLTNRAWLESLMANEGKPAPEKPADAATAPTSVPQGTLTAP